MKTRKCKGYTINSEKGELYNKYKVRKTEEVNLYISGEGQIWPKVDEFVGLS